MTANSALDSLASEFLHLRATEGVYAALRQKVAAKIIGIVGLKEHGQQTTNTDKHKVVSAPTFGYSVDWDRLQNNHELRNATPEEARPWKIKYEVDEAKLRNMRKEMPELYALYAEYISVKPNSPKLEVSTKEAA